MTEFDALLTRYNSQADDCLSDSVAKAVFLKSVPEPLRTHLQVNGAGNTTTYHKLVEAVRDFVQAQDTWSANYDPMEVDMIKGKSKGKFGGKDKKGNGKGNKNDGKGKGGCAAQR